MWIAATFLLGSALATVPQEPASRPDAPVSAEEPWHPHFEAAERSDAGTALIAWQAAAECTGRVGIAHATITLERRPIQGGFLGLAHWDAEGVYLIELDAKPERMAEVIVHEVAHAWIQAGPPTLVEGRTELLADCIVDKRPGLANLQWDDGRTLHRMPDLLSWNNMEDHGPALLADARTDAYLGAARMVRVASLLLPEGALWNAEPMTWESFRAALATVDHGDRLLKILDGGAEAQRTALEDADLDGLPLLAELILQTNPNRWDSDEDGWWDGAALGVPHMAVALPFDGSPMCTGLASEPGTQTSTMSGGNLRGEGHPVAKIRQTQPGAPLLVELTGKAEHVTGGIWAVVHGTHLQRDQRCTHTENATVWAAQSEFSHVIPEFLVALAKVSQRAELRWGPTTGRMAVALGTSTTRIDGQVVQISAADVEQAVRTGKTEELATLAVALHRVWDNGTRQWPVAAAMALSLAE